MTGRHIGLLGAFLVPVAMAGFWPERADACGWRPIVIYDVQVNIQGNHFVRPYQPMYVGARGPQYCPAPGFYYYRPVVRCHRLVPARRMHRRYWIGPHRAVPARCYYWGIYLRP
ncbi:MAG: hypothetical protein ACE5K7_01635 [Phycisphaerae bacterium]